MGMSIDESIENIVLIKKLEDSLGNISGNTNSVASQSLGCAIDTMRKYQKIEDIYYHQRGEALENSLRAALEQEPTTKNDLGVDCRSLEDIKKLVERKADALDGVMLDAGGVIIGLYFAIANDLTPVTPQELIHGKCNQCKYYEGVHNVQGHAPCSYHKIGGVLWNWYCSQFESEG